MKRTVDLLHRHADPGPVTLVVSFLVFAGCSGGDNAGGSAKVGAKYGLQKSEFIDLKKANRGPKAFQKALLKREMEKQRETGVVVETATSGKNTKKSR